MNRLACAVARVGEDLEMSRLMRRHSAGCLHCQVRTARAQRLRRALGSLRNAEVAAPSELMPGVMAQIGDLTAGQRRRGSALTHQMTAAVGAVVASAAGAAALALWRRSHSAA